jgi:large subunit ribosomal protein L1
MRRRSKRYRAAASQIDKAKKYGAQEACDLLKKITGASKWDQTVECAVKFGVDPRHVD